MKAWIVLLATCPVLAFGEYYYDYETDNSYSTHRSVSGSTEVQGFNLRTGSMWNTTMEPNGDMDGMDSDGNYWFYDSSTGYYQNIGTGKVCIGQGDLRVCN